MGRAVTAMQPPAPHTLPAQIAAPRLRLRALQPGDGPALFGAVEASRAHLHPFSPAAGAIHSAAEAERMARLAWADWLTGRAYRFGLWQEKGAFAGMVSLHYGEWSVPRFELGCWIHAAFAGRGYATEATRAAIDFAFEALGVLRLEIRFDHRNAASQRVAQKLGFTCEGRLLAHNRAADGALVDEVVYALLRD
ncbi:MAG: GNAT family N-acetyltransferase [Anaerolineae bacterium]|nr:GNAT family N-acetyltransferase [Anaerolineae bacterium]